jgi:murein DD-endopeptidase MepM/ murein hydrolase activator NlpD
MTAARHSGRLALALIALFAVAAVWLSARAPSVPGGPPNALRAAQVNSASAPMARDDALGTVAPAGAPALGLLGRLAEPPTPLPPDRLSGYRWPLARGRITLPFKAIPGGTRIKDGHLFHDGVDMATFCGDRVVAAHDGVVLAAGRHFDDAIGWVGDLGPYFRLLDRKHMWLDLPNVVVTDDGNGYRSMYAHFERVTVRVGQRVRAGQLIGYEGATGHASGCHVHYGVFSPLETATFGVRPDIIRQLRVPDAEIARIDPLLILPGGADALRTRQVPSSATAAPARWMVRPSADSAGR